MGNNQTGIVNKKLGVPIIGKIDPSTALNPRPGMVQACYILYPDNTISFSIARLFNILHVISSKVSIFCLLTGEKRSLSYTPRNCSIISSVMSYNYISFSHLIIAESNGGFAVINPYTLEVNKRFGLSHALPFLSEPKDTIFTMIAVAPEVLYVGYLSGQVKVWHIEMPNPQHIFGAPAESPPVRSLAYSHKHRKLIVGFEGSYIDDSNQYIHLDQNPLKLYIPNASQDTLPSISLTPFTGTCFCVSVLDSLNLIIALSSEDCQIFIWSLETGSLLLQTTLPALDSSQLPTTFLTIESSFKHFLVFGTSNSCVLVLQVETSEGQVSLLPIKKVLLKTEEISAISFLRYELQIDTLVLGNMLGVISLISNFLEVILS